MSEENRKSTIGLLLSSLLFSTLWFFPSTEIAAVAYPAPDPEAIVFNDGYCDLADAGYGGPGTTESPFLISDAASLWEITDCDSTDSPDVINFKVTENIDLANEARAPTDSPIGGGGGSPTFFGGLIDGNSKSITNVSISNPVNPYDSFESLGLFFALSGSHIANLTISGTISDVSENADYVGGLAGLSEGNVTVSNLTMNLNLTGGGDTGGLIGYVEPGYFLSATDITINGQITSETCNDPCADIGGIVGDFNGDGSLHELNIDVDIHISTSSSLENIGGLLGSSFQFGTQILETSAVIFQGSIHLTSSGSIDSVGGLVGEMISEDFARFEFLDYRNSANITLFSRIHVREVGAILGGLRHEGRTTENSIVNGSNEGQIRIEVLEEFAEGYAREIGGLVGLIEAKAGATDRFDLDIDNLLSSGGVALEVHGYVEKVGGLIGHISVSVSSYVNLTNLTNSGEISISSSDESAFIGGVLGLMACGSGDCGEAISLSITNVANQEHLTVNAINALQIGGLAGELNFTPASNLFLEQAQNAGNILVNVFEDPIHIAGIIGRVIGYSNLIASFVDVSNQGNIYVTASCNSGCNNPDEIAGIIGSLTTDENSTISASHISNAGLISISASESITDIGGLFGWLRPTDSIMSIENSTNSGEITLVSERVSDIGGLVGDISADGNSIFTITSSINSGRIQIDSVRGDAIGGFIGELSGNVSLAYLKNLGEVSADSEDYVGGLVGMIVNYGEVELTIVTISSSLNNERLLGGDYVGGLLGGDFIGGADLYTPQNEVHVLSSSNEGEVSGQENIAGLIGNKEVCGPLYISNSYNSGEISGDNKIGGFVGNFYQGTTADPSDTYSCLVGGDFRASAEITHSYNSGTVSGSISYDSIVGTASWTVSAFSVYSLFASRYVQFSSLNQMQSPSLYSGWDFNAIWGFGSCSDNNGLPILRAISTLQSINSTGCAGEAEENQDPVTPATDGQTTNSQPSYRGPLVTAYLVVTTPGATVQLDGVRLVNITAVSVGEISATFSVVSSGLMSVSIPNEITPSDYDLILFSPEGKLTIGKALRVISQIIQTPTETSPLTDKGKLLLGKTQSLPKFQFGKISLVPLQISWLSDRLSESGLTRIVCTGVIGKDMTMHQKIRIRERAKRTCQEIKRILPLVQTSHQSRVSVSTISLGRVLVTYVK